jgi:hypothetical protein
MTDKTIKPFPGFNNTLSGTTIIPAPKPVKKPKKGAKK